MGFLTNIYRSVNNVLFYSPHVRNPYHQMVFPQHFPYERVGDLLQVLLQSFLSKYIPRPMISYNLGGGRGGGHFKEICACALSLFSRVQLCDYGGSLQGFSVNGILQTRILEWAARPSFRGSSRLRNKPASLRSPALAGFYTIGTIWEAPQGILRHWN